jgi:ABC-type Mn2+/Zn2+ transport system permease subunit
MIAWLTEPWTHGFFTRGLAAAALAGGLTGLVGTYVVLRRMSAIGHGLSHAVLGGAVVGYLLGWSFYITGGVWGVVAAALVTGVGRSRRVGNDAAIGIVTTASYAVGIALISRGHGFTRNFEAAFFGDILGVTSTDIVVLAGIASAVAALIFFAYRRLLFVTFDAEVARSCGVRTGAVDALFAVVLAGAIVATMRVLGVTLIAAAIVTPAATARLRTDSFPRLLGMAVAIGAASGVGGMYVSFYADIASGATITLTASALFALTLGAGWLRRRWTRNRSEVEQLEGDGVGHAEGLPGGRRVLSEERFGIEPAVPEVVEVDPVRPQRGDAPVEVSGDVDGMRGSR